MDGRHFVVVGRYRAGMHTVRTGRDQHEIVEVFDTVHCTGCQGLLAYPHVKIGWLGCGCAGTDGHRTRYCLTCGTWNYEPGHDAQRSNVVGGVPYFGG